MQKFNTNGAFITKWGTAGPGNGSFQQIQAITADAVTLAGWDYVTAIPARGDAEYGVVVPTLADANAATRTYSVFMVSALTPNPYLYFDSPVEAGYSIDNLAPGAPTPFFAAYVAGVTQLHWGASTAGDFATFRLYRGASADFVPAASNLVAATPDTGYADGGAAGRYYKLAAVDVNGNESPYAAVGPAQTAGAGGRRLPGAPQSRRRRAGATSGGGGVKR